MDNQQVTREEIGWLAGIIDGEGYLGLQFYKDKRKKHGYHMGISPSLHISNTDEKIILKSRDIMRKLDVNPYVRVQKANKSIKKDNYRLQIHRMVKVEKILMVMLPYLTGTKQDRAKLVLEFIGNRKIAQFVWIPPRNGSRQSGPIKPYSMRDWQLYHECKANQKRGTSETIREAQRLTSEIWQKMRDREKARQLEAVKI